MVLRRSLTWRGPLSRAKWNDRAKWRTANQIVERNCPEGLERANAKTCKSHCCEAEMLGNFGRDLCCLTLSQSEGLS